MGKSRNLKKNCLPYMHLNNKFQIGNKIWHEGELMTKEGLFLGELSLYVNKWSPAVVSEINLCFTFVIQVRVKMSHQIMSHENHCGYYFHFIRHTRKVLCIALWDSAQCALCYTDEASFPCGLDKCRPTWCGLWGDKTGKDGTKERSTAVTVLVFFDKNVKYYIALSIIIT